MVSVARKSLFADKLRFAIAVGGVALSVMLILVLNGFYVGMNRQITAYLDNSGADLIVAQKGIRNFLGTRSLVPAWREQLIRRMPDVTSVVPVTSSYAVLELSGRKEFALLVGFDPAKGGGPWSMRQGDASPNDEEVIVDGAMADQYGLGLGDTVEILGEDFRVAGVSSGASSWMTGTFFITFDTAARLLATGKDPAFFLVKVSDPDRVDAVRRAIIRASGGLAVTRRDRVSANDVSLYAQVFNTPMRFMVAVAFAIGVMLVALTIYTATVERAREYGVLKAVGIRNGPLYAIVFEQAFVASVAGFAVGVALSLAARGFIQWLAPQFLISIEGPHVAALFLVALAMSVLASWVPVHAVATIDPAIAFRRGA